MSGQCACACQLNGTHTSGVLNPQELEKFKFVLDYKIKELKKQIEPREAEILEMKDQIKEVRACVQEQVK